MKYRYQYNKDGNILARIKGILAPIFTRQFETTTALEEGPKDYDSTKKEVTFYKNVPADPFDEDNPQFTRELNTDIPIKKIT